MGVMLLKIYVNKISDPHEKIDAIIYSMLWSCNYNGVIAVHPPSSITMNMPLMIKDLHNALLAKLEYTKIMLGTAGFTQKAGKRTRRARNKKRKSTRRRM